jgi:pyruvate decarboxylase
VIINNKGYTIERAIHGAKLKYNNIPTFDYSLLLSFFGGKSVPGTNYHLALTRDELESAMMSEHVRNPKEVQIVEVKMEPFDIPWKLAGLLKARGGER